MDKLPKLILLLFVLGLIGTSCVSTSKLTYLQDKEGEPLEVDTAGYQKLRRTYYKVQVNDLLSVQFRSFDAEVDKYFNIQGGNQNQQRMNQGQVGAGLYFTGYTVFNDGTLKLPILDRIYVNGLTIEEIEAKLDKRLKEFFKEGEVFVKVRLAGIRYSVIGETMREGQFYLFQNEANIFEALSNAGGVDFLGNRYSVQIVRMHPEGVKYYEIDLTDKRVVSDPRYFIQPNDIINVRPLKQKSWGIGSTGFQTFLSLLSAISSSLALIVAIQSFNR